MYHRSYPSPDSLPPNYNGTAFNQTQEDKPNTIPDANEGKDTKEKPFFSLPTDLESDDILLGTLIIMLLRSHSDDELLIILALLLLS